jgi:hypothetical protein
VTPAWSTNNPASKRAPVWLPAAVLAGGLLGAAGLRVAAEFRISLFPPCLWLKLSGFPCPGCGCTRSLLAWTHLDPVAAFRFNPLFSLALLLVGSWWVLSLLEGATGAPRLNRLRAAVEHRRFWWTCTAVAALNWVYLILFLPK